MLLGQSTIHHCNYDPTKQKLTRSCEIEETLEQPKWTNFDTSECNLQSNISKELEQLNQVLQKVAYILMYYFAIFYIARGCLDSLQSLILLFRAKVLGRVENPPATFPDSIPTPDKK